MKKCMRSISALHLHKAIVFSLLWICLPHMWQGCHSEFGGLFSVFSHIGYRSVLSSTYFSLSLALSFLFLLSSRFQTLLQQASTYSLRYYILLHFCILLYTTLYTFVTVLRKIILLVKISLCKLLITAERYNHISQIL